MLPFPRHDLCGLFFARAEGGGLADDVGVLRVYVIRGP